MAGKHTSRNFNFEPPETALTDNGDGTYTIHLYELVTLDQGNPTSPPPPGTPWMLTAWASMTSPASWSSLPNKIFCQ